MLLRRRFLVGGGLVLAAPALLPARAAPAVVEVLLRSDPDGARVGFDPIGLRVAPGTTVRWVVEANVHTTTAYHPDNDRHALRIPDGARPWDSGYLLDPGQAFEVTLAVEGTYDYYCAPHEVAGMVGRIIVGHAGGPGARPFDDAHDARRGWRPIPPAAKAAFPSVERIMAEGSVRAS
jgi:plastocyanin